MLNKQQATSNKQQATSNKQQATSNKQQAYSVNFTLFNHRVNNNPCGILHGFFGAL